MLHHGALTTRITTPGGRGGLLLWPIRAPKPEHPSCCVSGVRVRVLRGRGVCTALEDCPHSCPLPHGEGVTNLREVATVGEVNIPSGSHGSRSCGREKSIDTQAVEDTIRGLYWTSEHDHGHTLTRRPLPCNHRVALLSCLSSTMLTSALSGVWVACLRWPAGWSSWY